MSLGADIQDVLSLQDVALLQSITSLKSDPAKLNEFINTRKADLYNTVTKEHSDTFQKYFGDLQSASDTTKNILYYQVRNKDLDRIQSAVVEQTKQAADAATFDNQTAQRQMQATEWSVGSKQDTLFILQLVFIGLTLTAPLLFMTRAGMMPMSVFSGVSFLILLAIVLTIAVRAIYTEKVRDNRFWNRRRFAGMEGPPVIPTCESAQGLAESISSSIASTASTLEQGLPSLT